MWLHSKLEKQIQCVVLFVCHFWPWAFTQNIQLLCPRGLMVLPRGQAVRRPKFSFKVSHNLFRLQCCQQWHHLPLYFTFFFSRAKTVKTTNHNTQAFSTDFQVCCTKGKMYLWGWYHSSNEGFLGIWSTKSRRMGYLFSNDNVFLVLYFLH